MMSIAIKSHLLTSLLLLLKLLWAEHRLHTMLIMNMLQELYIDHSETNSNLAEQLLKSVTGTKASCQMLKQVARTSTQSSEPISSRSRREDKRKSSQQQSSVPTHLEVPNQKTQDMMVSGVQLKVSSTMTISSVCSPKVGVQISLLMATLTRTSGRELIKVVNEIQPKEK